VEVQKNKFAKTYKGDARLEVKLYEVYELILAELNIIKV